MKLNFKNSETTIDANAKFTDYVEQNVEEKPTTELQDRINYLSKGTKGQKLAAKVLSDRETFQPLIDAIVNAEQQRLKAWREWKPNLNDPNDMPPVDPEPLTLAKVLDPNSLYNQLQRKNKGLKPKAKPKTYSNKSSSSYSSSVSGNNWVAIICWTILWVAICVSTHSAAINATHSKAWHMILYFSGILIPIANSIAILYYMAMGEATAEKLSKTAIKVTFSWVGWMCMFAISIFAGALSGSVHYNDEKAYRYHEKYRMG